MRSIARAAVWRVVVCLATLGGVAIHGQQSPLRLTGEVDDPSGARVPDASIAFAGDGAEFDTHTGPEGEFSILLPPANYAVTVEAAGFARVETKLSRAALIEHRPLAIRLTVVTHKELVDVGQGGALNTSAAENLNAIVMGQDDLLALSSDEGTFQKELLALAGGSAGGAQIYIDGFSNGRIPPKNAIQSVRINRDPYSAVFDTLGFTRIEIESKAGGDKLHGAVSASGTQQALNSGDPFAPAPQPAYYILNSDGDLSGPLGRKSTFYLGGVFNDQQNNAAVNALLPSVYSTAVPDPQTTQSASLRMDRQFSDRDQLKGRYQFDRQALTNGGVGLLVLPSEGYASTSASHTFQLTDDFLFDARTANQLRGQYVHATIDQHSEQSASGLCATPLTPSCTVIVEGSFAGGGDPTQTISDTRNSIEIEDILSRQWGEHFFRFGGRFRLTHDTNISSTGFNGQFVFSSLQQYTAGQPEQFSLISGNPAASVTESDVALYAQDEWKLAPTLTLDYGFRFESQTGIPDHADPAPRAGAAWAPVHGKSKTPLFLLRGGFGVFYDRFLIDNLVSSQHQDGVHEQTAYVVDPTVLRQIYANGFAAAALPATEPTTYSVSPNLRTSYNLSESLSIERRLGRFGSIGATYLSSRGVHQYESINANAPQPGTGLRPLGNSSNVYQYSSAGIEKDQIGFVHWNITPRPWILLSGLYVLNDKRSSGQGATTFASNSYDIAQDFGRLPISQRQQLFAFLVLKLPKGFALNSYVTAQSGLPFNITTGADNNGDTIYNDRPSFATAASPAGSVAATRYGVFDLTPQPGETIIPINYGTGPSLLWTSASLSRSFDFGGHISAAAAGKPARREGGWQATFSVEGDNVTNHVNAAPLDGVLSSPLFGKPLSPWTGILTTTAANRVVFLRINLTR